MTLPKNWHSKWYNSEDRERKKMRKIESLRNSKMVMTYTRLSLDLCKKDEKEWKILPENIDEKEGRRRKSLREERDWKEDKKRKLMMVNKEAK